MCIGYLIYAPSPTCKSANEFFDAFMEFEIIYNLIVSCQIIPMN